MMAASAATEGSDETVSKRFWGKAGIYIWIMLLPMLLIGVGMWERSRNLETTQFYGGAEAGLSDDLAELRRLARYAPDALVRETGGDRRTVPVSMMIAEIEQLMPIARRGGMLSDIRGPLAMMAIGGGAAALLAGTAGMAIAAQAGATARRSREQLIAGFSRVHRMLPFLLGTLVLGLAVAIVGVAGFELIGMWFWDRVSGGAVKLMLFAVLIAGMAAYGAYAAIRGLRDIFALNTPEPIEQTARPVSEAEAPRLWQFVRELAERQKALMPDAIIVGIDGGFYVTEHPVRLHPGGQTLDGRTLYLPAPHLEMLDDAELAGVIGHELAHFVGEDTAYSRHFSPIYTGLERAVHAMGEATAKGFAMYPAFRLGIHSIERFDHAVKHWGRLREFEADRLSAIASGPRAIAHSLIRVGVITPVVTTALDSAFANPVAHGSDLVSDMVGLVRERGWPDMATHLEDRSSHPTDTHPSVPHRIEALGLQMDTGLAAAATRPLGADGSSPGSTLFADWLAMRRVLSADFIDTAVQAHTAHRAELEKAVAAVGQEPEVLYEHSGPLRWVLGVIGTLLILAACSVAVLTIPSGLGRDRNLIVGLVTVLAAAGIGLWAVVRALLRASRTPVFILAPDLLTIRGLAAPVRWLDIEAFHFSAGYTLQAVFLIGEAAPLPEKAGGGRRTRIKPKDRTVTAVSNGLRGQRRIPALNELFGRYLEAAYARKELADKAGLFAVADRVVPALQDVETPPDP